MVGDHITYLDCTSCNKVKACVIEARHNRLQEPHASHIRKGIIDHVRGDLFTIISSTHWYATESLIQIRRDIIAEAKAQEVPDNIISLDF